MIAGHFYALVSASLWASFTVLNKISSQTTDPTLATTIHSAITTLFLIGMAWSARTTYGEMGFASLLNYQGLFVVLGGGIAAGLSWVFYAYTIKYGSMGNIMTIDWLSMLLTILLSAALLGEPVNAKNIIGAILLITGTALISM
jgi:transporter family protein